MAADPTLVKEVLYNASYGKGYSISASAVKELGPQYSIDARDSPAAVALFKVMGSDAFSGPGSIVRIARLESLGAPIEEHRRYWSWKISCLDGRESVSVVPVDPTVDMVKDVIATAADDASAMQGIRRVLAIVPPQIFVRCA